MEISNEWILCAFPASLQGAPDLIRGPVLDENKGHGLAGLRIGVIHEDHKDQLSGWVDEITRIPERPHWALKQ